MRSTDHSKLVEYQATCTNYSRSTSLLHLTVAYYQVPAGTRSVPVPGMIPGTTDDYGIGHRLTTNITRYGVRNLVRITHENRMTGKQTFVKTKNSRKMDP